MPLTSLPRRRILTGSPEPVDRYQSSARMSLPHPASSTLPYRKSRILQSTSHSLKLFCRRHPVVAFFVFTYLVLFLHPLWFFVTHVKSHGFLVQPIPANHHVIGFLHRYVLPSVVIRLLYALGSGRPFTFQFPIPEIVNAKSPYEWSLPELSKPIYRPRRRIRHSASKVRIHDEAVMQNKQHYELVSPAYLAFHTFSIANSTKAREFRDLSRQHQRKRIPDEYVHLVDWQFVMASPPDWASDIWAQLEAEQAEHGDLLLLDEMVTTEDERMPENMNEGKTYRWMQEVVKRSEDGRGRQALWVMKTDADTYHVLPNLLDLLATYDAKEPTYFGSSYGISYTPNAYFQGLGYGVSWSLLRTLVDADIPKNLTIGHEDHVTGSWMWSLPALPRYSSGSKDPISQGLRLDPTNNIMAFAPPSVDPYTGLVRADFYARASSWFYWWIPKTEHMILTHGMKTKEEYLQASKWIDDLWLHPKWIGQSAHSPYLWQPPAWMQSFTLSQKR